MKKFLLVLTAIVLSFSLVFSFTACKDPDGGNQDPDDSITDITLNPAAGTLSFTGASDSAKEITATVTPDSAKNKDVTWSIVTGDDVVSIVQDGKKVTVTPKKDGTASIKVAANGKDTVSKTIAIGVGADNQIVSVTGVTLDKQTLSLKMGETTTGTLTATIAPNNATNKDVTWSVTASTPDGVVTVAPTSSSNTLVATVTAVKAGTATITVKTTDGEKTVTCAVTVAPADGGGNDPTPLTLFENGAFANCTASEAKDKDGKWQIVFNPSVNVEDYSKVIILFKTGDFFSWWAGGSAQDSGDNGDNDWLEDDELGTDSAGNPARWIIPITTIDNLATISFDGGGDDVPNSNGVNGGGGSGPWDCNIALFSSLLNNMINKIHLE